MNLQVGDTFLLNNGQMFGVVISVIEKKGICLVKFQSDVNKNVEIPSRVVWEHKIHEEKLEEA